MQNMKQMQNMKNNQNMQKYFTKVQGAAWAEYAEIETNAKYAKYVK